MKFLHWLSLPLITLYFPFTALAQVPSNSGSSAISSTSISRLIPPRFSVDYNSSGGGYDGFGGLEFLLPVQQEPGQRLDYLLGRVNITNGADVGGNLLFGTRNLNKCWVGQGNCFIGSYVGLDLTNTGEALFPQLGMGLEMLGDVELRLNGYLPLGDSRRQVATGRFVIPTEAQFQGNNLLFLDRSNPNRFQNALSGFYLEVGGKIAQLGQGGDLRGYGGVYSYGGDGIERYWGGRLRLEAHPNDVLSIGAGVQFDREFGTNLLFRVAASFPSLAQRQSRDRDPKLEQLAQPPLRQNSVVVAQRVEPARGPILVDPVSGQPYEFIHVSPNRGSKRGSGTAESPTNTIQKATALAAPTTDVIYVQPGNAGGGFTIPDGVAVLSVAPVQVIATQFGQIQLPGSGQGEAGRPMINDTVMMGNNTKLSGFEIQPPVNRLGVLVENAGNVLISDNTINASNTSEFEIFRNFPFGFAGILVRNETTPENVTIRGNTVITRGDEATGIIGNSRQDGSIAITGNTVSSSGEFSRGIEIRSNNLTITGNTVITSGDVSLAGYGSSGIIAFGDSVIISGNTVSNKSNIPTSAFLIFPSGINASGDSVIISDNIVNGTIGSINGGSRSGPVVISNNRVTSTIGSISGGSDTGSVTIKGNVVSTSGDFSGGGGPFGIRGGGGSTTSSVTITGNTISTSGDGAAGIRIDSLSIVGRITISDNTISADGADTAGIDIITRSQSSTPIPGDTDKVIVTISGNTIERAGQDGIRLRQLLSNSVCAIVSNNVIQNSTNGIGYRLTNINVENLSNGTFQIVDTSPVFPNTQTNNIGTFVFEPNITSFTNVPACP